MRMIEIDEYLYGMDRKKIDREKACELMIVIPISKSNATMNFWKGRVVDPLFPSCKSSRVEKNKSIANEFYRKAVYLDIERMAEDGDQYAQACLGWMYYLGDGVGKDHSLAFEWFLKAQSKAMLMRKIILDICMNMDMALIKMI